MHGGRRNSVARLFADELVPRLPRERLLASGDGRCALNANERRACDGLADDAPISESMEWLREHCERLAWELESTSRAYKEATDKLRRAERLEP